MAVVVYINHEIHGGNLVAQIKVEPSYFTRAGGKLFLCYISRFPLYLRYILMVVIVLCIQVYLQWNTHGICSMTLQLDL